MCISVRQARKVMERAARPRRQREEVGDDDDDDGACSDQGVIDDIIGTGAGKKVVDTDDEASAGSLGSSDSFDDEDPFDKVIIPTPVKPEAATSADAAVAATGADAATAEPRVRRSGLEPLWCDPYFLVWDHPSFEFLRIEMRNGWRQPLPNGMGVNSCTKQVMPRLVGENRDDPARTLLLLRAWALWRGRQDGWADAQRGRARHFREQAALLEKDIAAMASPCRLLGNAKANSLLRGLVPDIVGRLRPF